MVDLYEWSKEALSFKQRRSMSNSVDLANNNPIWKLSARLADQTLAWPGGPMSS